MSQEDFFRNVRTAVGMVTPRIRPDSMSEIEQVLLDDALIESAMWLSPDTVAGYDPKDFADLPEQSREQLQRAVEDFLAVASKVRRHHPPTREQFIAGGDAFRRIVSLVGPIVVGEWTTSVQRLVADVERWAQKHHWRCQREPKEMDELLLGSYQLPQLLIQVNGSTVLLNPVARFIARADGLVDLAIVPSYHSIMVPRTKDGWQVHIDAEKSERSSKREPWNEESFVHAVDLLRQRG